MSGAAVNVSVLAILPSREDQTSLKQIFRHSKWNLRHIEAVDGAGPLIEEFAAGVVISNDRLPDGRWQDVLRDLQSRRVEPLLIVASRLADEELWAEVLNRGGFDVLATPFRTQEVTRSVSLAWRHWRDRLAIGDRSAGRSMTAGGSPGQQAAS